MQALPQSLHPVNTSVCDILCAEGFWWICWLATLHAISDPYCQAASVAVPVCPAVCPSVHPVQAPNSKTKVGMTTKLAGKFPTAGVTGVPVFRPRGHRSDRIAQL